MLTQLTASLRSDLCPSPRRSPWLFGPRLPARVILVPAFLYLTYFGPSVVRGVWMLLAPWTRDQRWETREGIFHITHMLGSLGLLVMAISLALSRWGAVAALRRPRTRSDLVAEAWSVLLWAIPYLVFSQVLLEWIGSATGSPRYPEALNNSWGVAFDVCGALAAGVEEELLLGPLAVTLLRRAGLSWWAVFTTVGVARAFFHLYYGWGSISLALWGFASAACYAVTGRIWAVVILHFLSDLSLTLQTLGMPSATALPAIYVAAAVPIAALGLSHRSHRQDTP